MGVSGVGARVDSGAGVVGSGLWSWLFEFETFAEAEAEAEMLVCELVLVCELSGAGGCSCRLPQAGVA